MVPRADSSRRAKGGAAPDGKGQRIPHDQLGKSHHQESEVAEGLQAEAQAEALGQEGQRGHGSFDGEKVRKRARPQYEDRSVGYVDQPVVIAQAEEGEHAAQGQQAEEEPREGDRPGLDRTGRVLLGGRPGV